MNPLLKTIASTLLLCAVGAGAGLLGAKGFRAMTPDYVEGDYSAQRAQTSEKVILLGTTWCDYCSKTRDYLQSQGIPFADLDIEQSKQAEQWHKELGGQGVPVVLIGDRQIRGFNQKEIDAAIDALAEQSNG